MDLFERIPDHNQAMQLALDARQVQIWTTQPGIVTKVSDLGGKITVDVQPALQGKIRTPDGKVKLVNLPIIPDCSVAFQGGGGYVATFPIAVNDEVLIVHAARNIDGWWQNGGIQPPLDSRLHDITDAFVIPRLYSQATKFSGLSTTKAQLRTEDGTLLVELDKPNGQARILAPTKIVLDTPTVEITGVITVDNAHGGDVAGFLAGTLHAQGAMVAGFGTGDQVGVQSHTHTQPNDTHGDGEQPTNAPTAGT